MQTAEERETVRGCIIKKGFSTQRRGRKENGVKVSDKEVFCAKVRKKGANRLKIGVYAQKMCENIGTTDHSYNQIVKQ